MSAWGTSVLTPSLARFLNRIVLRFTFTLTYAKIGLFSVKKIETSSPVTAAQLLPVFTGFHVATRE